jgi:hypothetical protein
MRRRIRTVLAWLMVAVIACGNGLSISAEAAGHMVNGLTHVVSTGDGAHQHVSAHRHAGAERVAAAELNGGCGAAQCAPADHQEEPCCNVHAHCCVSIGFVPSCAGLVLLVPEDQRHYAFVATLLQTGMIYPVLRPPRRAA